MSRTAESTIKGFLYQFQKTIKEILQADYDSEITVEGIVEDVDVNHMNGSSTAIQCKYHESVETFTTSLIYKPILQMAEHFANNPTADIEYRLYVHVPSQPNSVRNITDTELSEALASTNRTLQSIISRIPTFTHQDFLAKLTLEFAPSIDDLAEEIKEILGEISIPNSDVESILYPNSINHIARLSCNDSAQERTIDRLAFENLLASSNSTAISRWTLALKTKKQLLSSKKKQLIQSLSINTRERCVYISKEQLLDFDDKIVVFINNFVSKYHSKATHTKTPIFAFDCNRDELDTITYRLYKKNITANTGYIGNNFDLDSLFRSPITPRSRSLPSEREFQVRLVSTQENPAALNYRKCDDIFFVCKNIPDSIDQTDIEVTEIEVPSFTELEFILSMRNDHE